MLGADVCWVGLARDFVQAQRLVADALLDPELAHGQVPHTADAAPPADANCRGGVGEERQVCLDAEVSGDGL